MPTRRAQVPLIVLLPQKRCVLALDRATGQPLWQVVTPFAVHNFIADEQVLYCEGLGEVCAVSMAGQLLWHNPLRGYGQAATMVLPGVTKAKLK